MNRQRVVLARKAIASVLAAAMISYGFPVFAAVGTSNVTVTIALVDKLVVTNGGTITLDNTTADPTVSGILGPALDATARLSYIHNKNVSKKITAQATASPSAAGNDIQLDVKLAGGSFVTVYDDAGATAAQDAQTGMAAGVYSQEVVTYQAQATAAGTPVGVQTNFDFTITYTSLDQ